MGEAANPTSRQRLGMGCRLSDSTPVGWLSDTFVPETSDWFGRPVRRVTGQTFEQQFAVDARGTAMMIAEFARRHIERGVTWGPIVGLTSGGPAGFPGEVSYGAAKAALENYTMAAGVRVGAPRDNSERGVPSGHRHRVGDGRGQAERGGELGSGPHRRA